MPDHFAHFVQVVSQFLDLAAQLMHFTVAFAAVFLVMAPVVIITFAMLAMGPSFDFLGQVVHAGGS